MNLWQSMFPFYKVLPYTQIHRHTHKKDLSQVVNLCKKASTNAALQQAVSQSGLSPHKQFF